MVHLNPMMKRNLKKQKVDRFVFHLDFSSVRDNREKYDRVFDNWNNLKENIGKENVGIGLDRLTVATGCWRSISIGWIKRIFWSKRSVVVVIGRSTISETLKRRFVIRIGLIERRRFSSKTILRFGTIATRVSRFVTTVTRWKKSNDLTKIWDFFFFTSIVSGARKIVLICKSIRIVRRRRSASVPSWRRRWCV